MEPRLEHTDEAGRHLAALVVDGERRSLVWTLDFRMRVGGAVWKMGGIAGVATQEAYRKRGYAARLMRESIAWMEKNGYDYSVLFGIRDFYHRFGYAPIFGWHRLGFKAAEAASFEGALEVRPATEDDLRAISKVYNLVESERTCSLVRPEGWAGAHKGLSWTSKAEYYIVQQGSDLTGYCALDSDTKHVEVVELAAATGADTAKVFGTLIAWFGKVAQERGVEEVGVHLPYDHPFAFFARRLDVEQRLEFFRNAEAMGRLINLESAFSKLEGELSRRLRKATLPKGAPDSVTLSCELGEVTLSCRGDEVRVSAGASGASRLVLPQPLLAQLVVGYRDFSDSILEEAVQAEGEPGPLIEALLPRQVGYIWRTDQF